MNAIRSDEELGTYILYMSTNGTGNGHGSRRTECRFSERNRTSHLCSHGTSEYLVYEMFPEIRPTLPQQIHFIHSEDLLQKYPTFTPKEREDAITKEYGAVFIIGIGCKLSNGEKHDGRARTMTTGRQLQKTDKSD